MIDIGELEREILVFYKGKTYSAVIFKNAILKIYVHNTRMQWGRRIERKTLKWSIEWPSNATLFAGIEQRLKPDGEIEYSTGEHR